MVGPTGSVDDPIPRRAARVVLVDAAGRVLLFEGRDPGRPGLTYWFTPGGGLDPGETPVQGAVRELREETGLRLSEPALGSPFWRQSTDFPFAGLWYRQEQEFFLVRVESWHVDVAGFDPVERDTIVGHRWWTVDELADTSAQFYPEELVPLLRGILEA